jgi:hypothetical protein
MGWLHRLWINGALPSSSAGDEHGVSVFAAFPPYGVTRHGLSMTLPNVPTIDCPSDISIGDGAEISTGDLHLNAAEGSI